MTKTESDILIINEAQRPPNLENSKEEVGAELERVLGSRTFRFAEGQKTFLKYTVEEVLAGRGHLIKEYLIGTEALQRGSSFDPRLDPIVRTQARKLRSRLALYYETEGKGNPLHIEFRKGSYAPSFQGASPVDQAGVVEAAPIVEPQPPDEPPPCLPMIEAVATEPVPPVVAARRWSVFKSWTVVLMLALIAAGVYAGFVLKRRRPAYLDASIAVIPFANLTAGSGGDDFFLSDGLPQEVSDLLQETPGLQVVARTSTSRFRSKSPNAAEITRKLKVHTVLVGSVSKRKDRLLVTVELNDQDGYRLWSGSYDRPQDETRAIPREIARAVINALGVTQPVRNDEAAAANQLKPNPGAHESYLKGLYFFHKLNAETLKTAIAYFQEAIAEDPSYARAYAGLADCYVVAPQVATMPPLEIVPKIKAAAAAALALDEHLGEPHIDLAVAAEYEYDWGKAEKEFQRGLELSPGNVTGHLWYAKYLGIIGRRPELLAQRRLAMQLDPVSVYAIQSVGGYLSVTGQYDAAIEQFRAALALEPGFGLAHQGLGVAYLLKGMKPQAIAELQIANDLMRGPRRTALLAFAYAANGNTTEAERILDDLRAGYVRGQTPALAVALVYIGLNNKDQAFEWLNKAIDQRDLNLDLQWDSFYEPLRSDVRYTELLRRMKLA
jgi:TolB-like protein/Tfp pilus assembly protein PilF